MFVLLCCAWFAIMSIASHVIMLTWTPSVDSCIGRTFGIPHNMCTLAWFVEHSLTLHDYIVSGSSITNAPWVHVRHLVEFNLVDHGVRYLLAWPAQALGSQ